MKEQEDFCIGGIDLGIKCPFCHQYFWIDHYFSTPPYKKDFEINYKELVNCPFCHNSFNIKIENKRFNEED